MNYYWCILVIYVYVMLLGNKMLGKEGGVWLNLMIRYVVDLIWYR